MEVTGQSSPSVIRSDRDWKILSFWLSRDANVFPGSRTEASKPVIVGRDGSLSGPLTRIFSGGTDLQRTAGIRHIKRACWVQW